jgi:hypothetical protein
MVPRAHQEGPTMLELLSPRLCEKDSITGAGDGIVCHVNIINAIFGPFRRPALGCGRWLRSSVSVHQGRGKL